MLNCVAQIASDVCKSEELNRVCLCLSCDLNVLFSAELKMLHLLPFLNPFVFFVPWLKAHTFTDSLL